MSAFAAMQLLCNVVTYFLCWQGQIVHVLNALHMLYF